MYGYLIYEALKKNRKADKSFHVPGHKGRGRFLKMFAGAAFDITELSYSDNLACPEGVIQRAQTDIARILNAERSYILTDGSTCGVLSMLYAAAKRGGKIIVQRNCHQSVWNACALFGLEPLIAAGRVEEGVLLPPAPEEIEKILRSEGDIAGAVVTSPDYYGNVAPLAEYAEILRRFGKLLLVDGAHGAHFACNILRHKHAAAYADMWVDGAHKSLATLTQGAVVSVNNGTLIADLEEALAVFRTSSPSYPIMASVEYGVKFAENYPQAAEAAKAAVEKFRNGATGIKFCPSDDWTKLAADFGAAGINAAEAERFLEKSGIYPEFSDGRYVLFYLSYETSRKDLKKLGKAFKIAMHTLGRGNAVAERVFPEIRRSVSYLNAVKSEREYVPLDCSEGRICARNAGFTPPCIPVICAGEVINRQAINALNGGGVYGLNDGKIAVVKI